MGIHCEAYLRAAAASHVSRGLDEKQSATAQENKTPPRTEQTRAFTLHTVRCNCDAVANGDKIEHTTGPPRTQRHPRSVLWARVNRIITSGFNATHFLTASRCSRKRNAFVHSQRAPTVLDHRKYCRDIITGARFKDARGPRMPRDKHTRAPVRRWSQRHVAYNPLSSTPNQIKQRSWRFVEVRSVS